MTEKIVRPHFQTYSFGARCDALFDEDMSWLAGDMGEHGLRKSRTQTRANYPYRFWLQEMGAEQKKWYRRSRVEHQFFRVALMSALREDETREFKQWFILQLPEWPEEEVFYLENVIQATPELDKESGDYEKSVIFAIDNGFTAPGTHDFIELEMILLGMGQDGLNPLI